MEEKKKLRVWWIPQVPMNKPFYVPVESEEEAKLILDTLSIYDQYQHQHNIKPDFSNIGGVQQFDEETKEWEDWHEEITGEDNFDDHCEDEKIKEGFVNTLIEINHIVF